MDDGPGQDVLRAGEDGKEKVSAKADSAVNVPEAIGGNNLSLLETAKLLAAGGMRVVPMTSVPTKAKPGESAHKNPGGLLGKGWQNKTSTNPHTIEKWFAPTDTDGAMQLGDMLDDSGIYREVPDESKLLGIHTGDNVVAVDIDNWSDVPPEYWDELLDPSVPFQSTSSTDPYRGHYLFAPRPGYRYGAGALTAAPGGSSPGEVRHGNSIIVSAPSEHQKAHLGRRYQWVRTGELPVMPEHLAEWVGRNAASKGSSWQEATWNGADLLFDAATGNVVDNFIATCTAASHPDIVADHVAFMETLSESSLHTAFLGPLVDLMKFAAFGFVNASDAAAAAMDAFIRLRTDPARGALGGTVADEASAQREFGNSLFWAIGKTVAQLHVDADALQYEAFDQVRRYYASDVELPAVPESLEPAVADPLEAVRLKYPAVDIAALMASPPAPPEWLEEGMFAKGGYYGITSAAKAGKSLLTYWMAGHWALGRSAFDPTRTFSRLRVLYLDYENGTHWLHDRLTSMAFPPTVGDNLIVQSFPGLPYLNTKAGGKELGQLVDAYEPDVLVIDTISRTVNGDENSAEVWSSLFSESISPLRKRLPDLMILRLDHTGKDPERGARGSSQKMSDLETHWVLTAASDRDGNSLTLRNERSRLAEHADVVHIRRVDGPLGHVVDTSRGGIAWGAILDADADVTAINDVLDELDASNSVSNRDVKEMFKSSGHHYGSDCIAAALRHRKARAPEVVANRPETSES